MNGSALGILLRREFLRPPTRPRDYLGRVVLAAAFASAMPLAVSYAYFDRASGWVFAQVTLIGIVVALGQAFTLRSSLSRELTERSYGFLLLSDLGVRGSLLQHLIRRIPAMATLCLMMLVPLIWAARTSIKPLAAWHVLAIPVLIIMVWLVFSGVCAVGAALWPGMSGGDLLLIGYFFRLGIPSMLIAVVPWRFLGPNLARYITDEHTANVVVGWIAPFFPPLSLAISGHIAAWPTWLAAILGLAIEGTILLALAAPLLAWRERRQGLRSWKERLQTWFRERTWYHKPPITDDQPALTWRDYVFLHGGPRFSFWVITAAWLIAVGLVLLVRYVTSASAAADPWSDEDPWWVVFMHTLTFWAVCVAATLPLVFVSQASRSWDLDRNSHALELLLLTPMSGREIALAKLKALWMSARLPLILVLIPATCITPLDVALSYIYDGWEVPWGRIVAVTCLVLLVGAWFIWMLLLANLRLGLVRKGKKQTFTLGPLFIPLIGGLSMVLVSAYLEQFHSKILLTMALIFMSFLLVAMLIHYHFWLHREVFRDLRETMLEVASRTEEEDPKGG